MMIRRRQGILVVAIIIALLCCTAPATLALTTQSSLWTSSRSRAGAAAVATPCRCRRIELPRFSFSCRETRRAPSSRLTLPLQAFSSSTSGSSDDERKSNHDAAANEPTRRRRRKWLCRLQRRAQAMFAQCRQWMTSVQRRPKQLLIVAAFALSVLLSDGGGGHWQQQQQNNYQVAAAQQQPAPIERVIPAAQSATTSRIQLASTALRGDEATTTASATTRTVTLASSATTTTTSTASTTQPFPRGGGGNRKQSQQSQSLQASVEEGMVTARRNTGKTVRQALADLSAYMQGPKSDTLLLLLATALIPAVSKRLGTSSILGFLASGMLLGPNGFGLISGIHTTETLAELGIVFFLFEMGIELSLERLAQMRKDVFGLGLLQFTVTAAAVAGSAAVAAPGLPAAALVVLGGGLALSSSAFVLQLLKDKNQLATRFGKAAFGVLLFQDLAVVPLLVVTPILAGAGTGLASAVTSAVVKAVLALTSIAFAGRVLLNPLFKIVAAAQSQEAFLGVILLTVLSMSFMTEGLGLSNTLGAFLAGVLLSETKYRYQIEADIAPFRGVLLGLFFVTVGFEIDVHLIASNLPQVTAIVVGILSLKTVVTTALSLLFGLSLATSQNTGLILSQGGEFAFVAFGLARSLGILEGSTTKLMLTAVSLTMALTPAVADLGGRIAKRLEERSDFTHYLGQDRDANEIKESEDFAVVVGYGVVGKVVCDLLDRKFIKYVGLEIDPNKAIQARNAGLPVFYGDIGRQEVADAFNVGKAKAVIVCIADKAQCNRAVIALRRWYPDLKIFSRAANADHANRLQDTLNVAAMVPILPEDNLLLTLPFGGAVMKALGVPNEEANAILEAKRKEVLTGKGLYENEEEAALAQLAIPVPDDTPGTRLATVGVVVDDADSVEAMAKIEEAAAERFEKTKEKSPFVAQVIEDVCPSVGAETDEEEVEDDTTTAAAAENAAEDVVLDVPAAELPLGDGEDEVPVALPVSSSNVTEALGDATDATDAAGLVEEQDDAFQ